MSMYKYIQWLFSYIYSGANTTRESEPGVNNPGKSEPGQNITRENNPNPKPNNFTDSIKLYKFKPRTRVLENKPKPVFTHDKLINELRNYSPQKKSFDQYIKYTPETKPLTILDQIPTFRFKNKN